MSRIDQINQLLREQVANFITKEIELENGMITVCYVDCTPDLKTAKIAVSVLPENKAGTALKKLKKHSSALSSQLQKKLNLKNIPKFNWIIDTTEKEAAEIEDILREIKNPKS